MWTHDKFEDGKAPAAGEQPVPVETTVRLSNLHWDVSTDDLHELFGHKFGILKSANLKYDAAGRSECIADLVFVTRESALNAVELYNGRELDGLPMLLKLVESVSNRLGPAGKTAGRSSRTTDQRDGRGQTRLASAPASKKPVDDMDVDMDAPVRSGGSNSNNSRDRNRRPNSHGAAASANGKAAQSGNSSGNNSNKKLDDRLGKTLDARLGKTLDDRLGKSLEERLGRKLEDRLGPLSIGPLGSDGDWRSAQRGSRTSGNNRGRQQRDSGVTQMLLDAQMDAYKSTASGRKNPRQIVSYAGTQVPMDGNMI
ncbi:hypothetical protein BC831DRAFT_458925 [Entophlyctis helioformis]|nr:hypothetical protein BC831DRAFT_458925 [Entophlyctis helioformis]